MQQVHLIPYDPTWPSRFEEERAALERVFGDSAVRIEHIGSTAVPGLVAKPILDILVGVEDLVRVEQRTDSLGDLGYEYVPEYERLIPDRRYFRKPSVRPRTHHLHCVVLEGEFWNRHILFRDRLRSDPALASVYGELKLRLARTQDRQGYTEAKSPFIESALR